MVAATTILMVMAFTAMVMASTAVVMAPSVATVFPMESFMPTSALATVVLLIKFPVITVAVSVSVPIRIISVKIPPVMRLAFKPHIPPGAVPVIGSYDKGGRISVIRGPSVPLAEKVIQDSI